MSLLLRSILIIFISIGNISLLYGQKLDNPLDPMKPRLPEELGALIGMGSNFQNGEFYVNCKDCIFESGAGFGFMFGAVYENSLTKLLRYGAYAAYNDMSIKSTFRETELVPFTDESGQKVNIPVSFRHTGETNFNFLTAVPFVKFTPADWFFVRLGPSFSLPLNSSIKHTQEILDKVINYDGVDYIVELDGYKGFAKVIENGDFPEVNSLLIGLNPAIGFTIKVSDRWRLSPIFEYYIPLTNVSEKGSNFKINAWRLIFELRYDFIRNTGIYILDKG